MVLMDPTSAVAANPLVDSCVVLSSSRLFRESAGNPLWLRNSTPMMGVFTSSTIICHLIARRRDRSRDKVMVSYVAIRVIFAGNSS